jgi:ribosomal protein S27AE
MYARQRTLTTVGGVVIALLLLGGTALTLMTMFSRRTEDALLLALVAFPCAGLALACLPAWRHPRWRPVVVLGCMAALATVVAMAGVLKLHRQRWEDATALLFTTTALLAFLCLTTLARVRGRPLWALVAARLAAVLMAGIIGTIILGDIGPRFGVPVLLSATTLLACSTLTLVMLHWRGAAQAPCVTTPAMALQLTCPRCGVSQHLPAGRAQCRECGLVLKITIEDETCSRCGYLLYGLTSARCPECGADVLPRATHAARRVTDADACADETEVSQA